MENNFCSAAGPPVETPITKILEYNIGKDEMAGVGLKVNAPFLFCVTYICAVRIRSRSISKVNVLFNSFFGM